MSCSGIPEIDVPILTEENIILSIKDYINVPFSTAELRQPTPEKLHTIFGAFVCCMLQISNEQITQLPLHVMETITNQDLHIEEGAGHILFIKAVAYFMEKSGIPDFNLSNILHPTKKRTRKLLSAIVNYAQFAASYSYPPKAEILAKLDVIKKEQEQYIRKKEDLPAKIANLKSRRLERQRSVQELNLSAMKAHLEELEASNKEKMVNNARSEAEVEELKNLLTVARSSRLIHEGREAVEIRKSRTNVMLVKETLVTQIEEVTPSALRLVQDIEQEALKYDLLTNDLEKVKDNSLEMSKAFKTISAEKQNVESLINAKVDKKERFIAQCIEKDKFLKDTEQKLSDKNLAVQDCIKNKHQQYCKVQEELNRVEQLILLYGEEHEVTIRSFAEKSASLQSKLFDYHHKIVSAYQ